MQWPVWWEWELELSPHLLKRMVDRGFSESELRTMFSTAHGLVPDHIHGRWVVRTWHDGRAWEVIVEPAPDEELLVVITAYEVNR